MAYTTIDDPSAHFQTVIYTGTSGNARQVTNDGNSDLKPDLVWIKGRSNQSHNLLYDSTRGVNKQVYSDIHNTEATATNGLQQFTTDGFKVGSYVYANENGHTFVGWQWKANGGTTSSNTDGALTSTVQANTTAGFSILTFTTNGTTSTIGHGLGVKPEVVIYRSRNAAGGPLLITNVLDGGMDYAYLSLENAFAAIGYDQNTTSLVQYNDNNTNTQVAYAFKQIKGYSKFGRYYGNGNIDGTFIYCGFKPAWVMVKNVNSGVSWMIQDSTRDRTNPVYHRLKTNSDAAEATNMNFLEFHSNGFKTTVNDSSWNTANQYYFYMAFAESPFVSSTGTPTTAR